MKILKVLLGVISGLILISLMVESIEVLLVQAFSGMNFSALTNPENQSVYFETRNQPAILLLKMLYSLLGGFVGGYVATWISSPNAKLASLTLAGLQVFTLVWAGFLFRGTFRYRPCLDVDVPDSDSSSRYLVGVQCSNEKEGTRSCRIGVFGPIHGIP